MVRSEAAANDPPTGLSLSLPGVESTESTKLSTESTQSKINPIQLLPPPPPPAAPPRSNDVFMPFTAELMAVMQEMIRVEVRNYMVGLEQKQKRGICINVNEGFRDKAMNRIGISRID